MKTLFVYYSLTGNGDLIAEFMREKGAEVRKVETAKPMPRSFFGAIMKGGFLATIGHKSKLCPWDQSSEEYDRIVIGSPIWNGRLSSPINTVLSCLELTGKEVSFLLYAGGGTAPKAEKRIAKESPKASVIVLKEPKKHPEEFGKLRDLF